MRGTAFRGYDEISNGMFLGRSKVILPAHPTNSRAKVFSAIWAGNHRAVSRIGHGSRPFAGGWRHGAVGACALAAIGRYNVPGACGLNSGLPTSLMLACALVGAQHCVVFR
jgi:hypothetical protein